MPSIHYLNPPPNPFWDFIAGLEDHPVVTGFARPGNTTNNQSDPAAEPEQAAEMSEKARGKQATVEDPPEVDPTPLDPSGEKGPDGASDIPFRARGRGCPGSGERQEGARRGHGCRGRGGFEGRGGGHHHHHGGPPHHHGGPLPFMFGPPHGPWWARRGPPADGEGHGPHGGGPPHHRHRGPWAPSPHRGPGGHEGFNLPEFLNNLGQRLGVDLSGAAESLGLDRFAGPRANNDADFEPRADVFDTPSNYLIHVSLPGAKKSDVGVDWDGENSVLRIAGVVHRPGADEELLKHLAVDGRKRETGVFEKALRLGTRNDPASVDVANISARMVDGVLVVTVPKVEVEYKKREVSISGSSPARSDKQKDDEPHNLIDADEVEMHDAPVAAVAPVSEAARAKKAEAARDDRSETMDVEHAEQLPEYQVESKEEEHQESDWEKDGSDEEGEYVKINVD